MKPRKRLSCHTNHGTNLYADDCFSILTNQIFLSFARYPLSCWIDRTLCGLAYEIHMNDLSLISISMRYTFTYCNPTTLCTSCSLAAAFRKLGRPWHAPSAHDLACSRWTDQFDQHTMVWRYLEHPHRPDLPGAYVRPAYERSEIMPKRAKFLRQWYSYVRNVAIGAVALASNMSIQQNMAAGLGMKLR